MTQRLAVLVSSLLLCSFAATLWGQSGSSVKTQSGMSIQLGNSSPQATPSTQAGAALPNTLAAADQLFAAGKVPEATVRYQALVKADPTSEGAQVGLLRCYLVQGKLDDAQAAADRALAVLPKAPLLLTTVGDLQYRLGKLPEAERSYIKAENLKPTEPAPYLGLSRVYRAFSLYRRAYDNMKKARELAPDDLAIQLLWFNSLPQAERIPSLEAYLAGPAGQNQRLARPMGQYLAFLKKNAAAPVHACKLVSNVQETNTKLLAVPRGQNPLGASGLVVKINKEDLHLALDTGANGILLGRAAAEKAGLQKLAFQPIAGMGDAGQQGGYTAAVDRIRIGDLEFQDCVVRVTDAATPVTGQDGLIGSDVFSSYLIDIDIPGAKLRLSPLPKRPDAAPAPPVLKTQTQDPQEIAAENPEEEAAAAKAAAPVFPPPKDAYVAPEMAQWTKVYRFRNLLMVPTKVDRTGPFLFMIDTGSFSNILSTRTAQLVTRVTSDSSMQIKGMSGNVSQVYRADKAALWFGRYEQQNQDVVTLDLNAVSRQSGVEVSGILGYAMLRILQVKIDYRDGLVDFVYDPHRLPKQVTLKK